MKRYKFAKIIVNHFPTRADLENPYIFGGIRAVVNVSENEDEEMVSSFYTKGIEYYHFPLKEEVADMGWENIIRAVSIILDKIRNEIPVMIHCTGGNNRSRLVAECVYYSIYGSDYPDDYKGEVNHLIYNVMNHHIPYSLDAVHKELKGLFS